MQHRVPVSTNTPTITAARKAFSISVYFYSLYSISLQSHAIRNRQIWLGFEGRGGGDRWKATKPYHVALEDSYIRRNWDEITGLCQLNGLPFEATGERIRGTSSWCIFQFANQEDAMMFWARFEGKWLIGCEFVFPQKPDDMPTMKEPERLKDFRRKAPDLRR